MAIRFRNYTAAVLRVIQVYPKLVTVAVEPMNGLVIVQLSPSGTYNACPNCLILANASAGDITINLPPQSSTSGGDALIIKRVDSSGHNVNVAGTRGDQVNGNPSITLSQQGQGRWFIPGAPQGAAAGTGWMSY